MSWCSKWVNGDEFPDGVEVTLGRDGNNRCYVPKDECDTIKAENARLRELYREIMGAWENSEYSGMADYLSRMHELGIEVGL